MLILILGAIALGLIIYIFWNKPQIILIIGLMLLIFGIWAMFSVSTFESFTVTLKSSSYLEPSNYFYFSRHLRNIVFAIILSWIVYKLPLKFFSKPNTAKVIIIIAILLQLAVFVPGIGANYQGTRGWINLPLIPNIQPSEFFKIAYVIFMAYWLLFKKKQVENKQFIISFIFINTILLGIFAVMPDFGTAIIIGLVGLVMLRYSGVKIKIVSMIFVGGLGLSIVGLSIMFSLFPKKFFYIQKRLTYFISSDVDPQNQQIGWQTNQSLMAIGGGGLRGKGYGKGLQKFGYLPESQSDFIFAAFSEEIGFTGNMMLLFLYFILLYYVFTRLKHIDDPQTRMLCVGLISLIIIQVFINIGVTLKLLPTTGVTLPFISHGGTALMANMIELILLYKIATAYETKKRSKQSLSHRKY